MTYKAKNVNRVLFQWTKTGEIPNNNMPFQQAGRRKTHKPALLTKQKKPRFLNKALTRDELIKQIHKLYKVDKQHGTGFLDDIGGTISKLLPIGLSLIGLGKKSHNKLEHKRDELINQVHHFHNIDEQHGTGFLNDLTDTISKVLPIGLSLIGLGKKHKLNPKLRKAGIKPLRGKGFFSSIKKMVKSTKDRIIQTFTGRNKLPPSARKTLEHHGTEIIKSMYICRIPVISMVEKALNLISLGSLARSKNILEYDKLYHLFLFIITDKGTSIRIEKNEVINISPASKGHENNRDEIKIDINKEITLNELIENTQKFMGDKFLKYSASSNNCQLFINSILDANNLNNETIKNFVMQNTQELFKNMPNYVKNISDVITGVASRANVAINGAGRKKIIVKYVK